MTLDCDAVRARLRDGAPLDDLDEHAADCPGCAALLADGATLGRALAAAPPPAPDLLDAVAADLARDTGFRARLRRAPSWAHALALATASVALVGGVAIGALRPDYPLYPTDRMVAALGSLASVAVAGIALGTRPLHQPAPPDGLRRALLGTLIVPPLMLAALPAAHLAHPAAVPDHLPASVATCFAVGSVVAAAFTALARLVDRRTRLDPATGVVWVATGGVVGDLVLQLLCPVTTPEHLLPGHGALALVWAAVASLIVRPRT